MYIIVINILMLIIGITLNIIIIIVIIVIIILLLLSPLVLLPYWLNPNGRYFKSDNYLLQFLCHMTSDVKFLWIKIT